MIAEALNIVKEKYFAIVLDSYFDGAVMLGSPIGGIDIEEIAQKYPEKILKVFIFVFDIHQIQILQNDSQSQSQFQFQSVLYEKATKMAKFLEFESKYIENVLQFHYIISIIVGFFTNIKII